MIALNVIHEPTTDLVYGSPNDPQRSTGVLCQQAPIDVVAAFVGNIPEEGANDVNAISYFDCSSALRIIGNGSACPG
jgi:hypothetical protein